MLPCVPSAQASASESLIFVCCCRSFYTKVDDYFPKEQVFQWDPRTNTLEELCAFLEISPCPKKGKESWQSQQWGHNRGGIFGTTPFWRCLSHWTPLFENFSESMIWDGICTANLRVYLNKTTKMVGTFVSYTKNDWNQKIPILPSGNVATENHYA